MQQELQAKVKAGIKPSHLKRSRSAEELTKPAQLLVVEQELTTLKTKLQGQDPSLLLKARTDLILIKNRLQPLFTEQLKPSELVDKLLEQKTALADQLLAKRVENLQEFGDYQEKVTGIKATELTELANLRTENTHLLAKNQLYQQKNKNLQAKLSYSANTFPEVDQLSLLLFFGLILGVSSLTYLYYYSE